MNLESIRDKVEESHRSSQGDAEKYEQSKCWSFAYLTRWVVLEAGLKSIYDFHNRARLKKELNEWIDYLNSDLNSKGKKRPKKINNFTIQTATIPKYEFVEEVLGVCDCIETVIDSQKKVPKKEKSYCTQSERV